MMQTGRSLLDTDSLPVTQDSLTESMDYEQILRFARWALRYMGSLSIPEELPQLVPQRILQRVPQRVLLSSNDSITINVVNIHPNVEFRRHLDFSFLDLLSNSPKKNTSRGDIHIRVTHISALQFIAENPNFLEDFNVAMISGTDSSHGKF
jgi:hypothetical protein